MKKAFSGNHLIKKVFLYLSVLFLIAVLIWGSVSLTISYKYKISYGDSAKQSLRYAVLSTIYYFTLIYDPSPVKPVSFQPLTHDNINWNDYIRVEDLFNGNKTHGKFSLNKINNEKIIKSRFNFSYQPYGEARLAKLRKEYNLNGVVASAKDEFEAMILLRNWTRSQFRRNDFQPFLENFDALTILKRNYHNKNNQPYQSHQYRPCHFFPLFYSQIMLSMGYQIRIVQISHDSYGGHGMTEVWSSQYDKWITMDPDINAYYDKNGIPQNILELHNERYENKPYKVKKIRGVQTSGDGKHLKGSGSINEMVDYHSYIRIVDMRNDWITNHYFSGHPKKSDRASLFWVDKNMPLVFNLYQKTDNKDDFYWTLNQAEIWGKKEFNQDKLNMPLAFKTFTPNFDHFEVELDGSVKIKITEPDFIWEFHTGVNRLSVYPVNKYGIKGVQSFIEIYVE